VARLEYYETDELRQIVQRAASILGVTIEADAAAEIASRSRGTPRIANRLLRRVRDFAQVKDSGTITAAVADEALRTFGVDELGLDKVDRSVLHVICERFSGGPVGLSTLAIAVSEQTETIEDVYEPFLIREGLLARTPRGRVATPAAFLHLGLTPPERAPELF
jgi:Holliday junction DNA helicase RuvB